MKKELNTPSMTLAGAGSSSYTGPHTPNGTEQLKTKEKSAPAKKQNFHSSALKFFRISPYARQATALPSETKNPQKPWLLGISGAADQI
ncbi:hypothetical protein LI073_06540 [bacterium 210917-SL.2.15]|nr:hypothetical protein [bacterium 210917-SL.2.15]